MPYNGPTFDQLIVPGFEAIKALGGKASNVAMLAKVAELLDIDNETMEVLHAEGRGNQTEVGYRLAWARTYLKKGGYITDSARGVWELTDKGQATQTLDPSALVQQVRAMEENQDTNYWLVGASTEHGTSDRTQELVEKGEWRIWHSGKGSSKYHEDILSMKPGDRIAIKSSYTRKKGLPFDNQGKAVSVNGIKAVGIIKENPGDGTHVLVDWENIYEEPREWYFFTSRSSVWRLNLEHQSRGEFARQLVDFVFNGEDQDIDYFLSEPFWGDKYSVILQEVDTTFSTQFSWIPFYEAFATALLNWQNQRPVLLQRIRELIESGEVPYLDYLSEDDGSGERVILQDICPFTVMATFNRSVTYENRRLIAAALAKVLGVEEEVPQSFDGIPVMNNQKSWFFAARDKRDPGDIDRLWQMFERVIEYSVAVDRGEEEPLRSEFAKAYDALIRQRGLRWTPTFGFYWIRPRHFVPLDQNTRQYLTDVFETEFPADNKYTDFTGEDYLALIDDLKAWFDTPESPVSNFMELSYAAWKRVDEKAVKVQSPEAEFETNAEGVQEYPSYSIKQMIEDGCFITESELERMKAQLRQQKNLILQGPPGTGKTWVSKRLAYALIGAQREPDVVALQFHPTLSYEDFVRGWRPGVDGRLTLEDGPLMRTIREAKKHPNREFVVVIEEINRGNPAQIFGEMLTLLEGDKRDKAYGLRLSHMRDAEGSVYVPANVFVIGTMNNADRSLAMLDYALRRRFSFFDLKPEFNARWIRWLTSKAEIPESLARTIANRLTALNTVIENDSALGKDFLIGHSYVTPRVGVIQDPTGWYRERVLTAIKPLLEEYWFDRPDIARSQAEVLLEGL